MGIIDPMVVSSAVLTGGLEFSSWPSLWMMTIGLLSTAAAAVALSGLRLGRLTRVSVPRLAHPQLAVLGVSRVK
jgi:hypothetical protein